MKLLEVLEVKRHDPNTLLLQCKFDDSPEEVVIYCARPDDVSPFGKKLYKDASEGKWGKVI